jgi:hypothetical protein
LWQRVDVAPGLILASTAALAAGLVLALFPRSAQTPQVAAAASPAD